MDAKYLAEIKKDANRLVKLADNPYCQGPVSLLDGVKRVVPALLAEVERLTVENATLKKALKLAEETINHYAGCWECETRCTLGCAKAFYCGDCPEWKWQGIQQTQEQEGKK